MEQIVASLPTDPMLAVFVVQHTGPNFSILPQILSRAGPLHAFHPRDGDAVQIGAIHIAPPDRHMLVIEGRVRLSLGPHENRSRPAIDPTMRSLAVEFGPRVQGVLLSGHLDDGVSGLVAIKRCGGVAIVQDPSEAPVPSMPRTAVENVAVDRILPGSAIGAAIASYAIEESTVLAPPVPADIRLEVNVAAHQAGARMEASPRLGTPSTLCCPSCNGTLWEVEDGGEVRYRCRTGHAFGALSLNAAQNEAVENAVIIALRTLDERADLYRGMAERAQQKGRDLLVRRWKQHLRETNESRVKLREALRMPALSELPEG